jgi:hypothetical protein
MKKRDAFEVNRPRDLDFCDDAHGASIAKLATTNVASECLGPAGFDVRSHDVGLGKPHASDRAEEAVLPLADRVGDVLQLAAQVDVADQRLESMALQVFGDRIPIHGAGAFECLPENLAVGVIIRASIVVGVDPGDVLVKLEESARLFVVRDASEADDIFGRSAVFAIVARKGTADAVVVGLYVQVFDLGLIGQAERVGWIRPRDERIGIAAPTALMTGV